MWLLWLIPIGLIALAIYDVVQRQHAILRNFPILGHFRYWFEAIGPELRQYIVTDNNEERPFSRDQRTWVYASSKRENSYFGFGTDNELELSPNYLIVRHAAFPLVAPRPGEPGHDPLYRMPCAKVLGGARGRARAFRPGSAVNVSGMSYGSLSAPAIEALNQGCRLAGALHNTGEGAVSPHHQHGAELILQIGTGYFGCRDAEGRFCLERLREVVDANPVRAIEVKLSQGAKPGMGGLLPAAKITREISRIRGIPMGVDCVSPARHSAFGDVDSLLDFVEGLADATGLPVGIKSAVGQMEFWQELARKMNGTGRGVDFIAIDGGEGGTGAGPLVFTDHVALPFKLGMSSVYRAFTTEGIHEQVVFIGGGKLGFPAEALFAFGLGCDMINVGRTAMLAIGCIQAQRCHTGHCPTGVATQNRWLMRGLDPTLKAARLANYVVTLRKELLALSRACGVCHPALVTLEEFAILDDHLHSHPARTWLGYPEGCSLPAKGEREEIVRLMGSLCEPARA